MYIPWDLIKHLLSINNNMMCTPETLFRHHIDFNNNLGLQVHIGSMSNQSLNDAVIATHCCHHQTSQSILK